MQVMHFFLLIYLPILLETLIVNISLICTLGLFDRRVGSFFPPPTTSQSHHSTKVASPFPHHTHGSQATADHGGSFDQTLKYKKNKYYAELQRKPLHIVKLK